MKIQLTEKAPLIHERNDLGGEGHVFVFIARGGAAQVAEMRQTVLQAAEQHMAIRRPRPAPCKGCPDS